MPDDARAHNALAVALTKINEIRQAFTELEAAQHLEPNNPLFQANLACLKQHLQNCAMTP
ncbi:MAG: hypothetical protein DMG06_11645 [Acidobacteria bacterium]|nr:MAG: hypothetical protein DMG06_11645 [Acidobacteriota bacterium]